MDQQYNSVQKNGETKQTQFSRFAFIPMSGRNFSEDKRFQAAGPVSNRPDEAAIKSQFRPILNCS
jgi:hypothetical protein